MWLVSIILLGVGAVILALAVWLLLVLPARFLSRLSASEGVEPESPWGPLAYSVAIFNTLGWLLGSVTGEKDIFWQGLGRLSPMFWWAALVGPPFLSRFWPPTQKGRLSSLRLVLIGLAGLVVMGWLDLLSYRLLSHC